jgi:glutamyl-tRNA synthetase
LGIETEDDGQLEQIVVSQRERAKTLKDMAANSAFFFRAPAAYDEKAVRKNVTPEILAVLGATRAALAELPAWTPPAIHALISDMATAHTLPLGKLAQPIRIAVCGGTVSPPIDQTLAILGQAETLARLAAASAAWAG